jgi:sperm-associated antigen 16 protein
MFILATSASKRSVPKAQSETEPKNPAKRAFSHKEAILPADDRLNTYLNVELPSAKPDRLKLISNFKAHNMAISGMKFHPKKQVIATVSDDKSWKMWAFPSGELIMSGEGHKDWIADCDFHPR